MELPNTLHLDKLKKVPGAVFLNNRSLINNARYPHKKNGFTLLETITVIAIMGTILAFSIVVSFNSYKGYVFRVERNVLISILTRARSQAMNNYFETSHGVCLIPPNFILFRGTTCIPNALTNELIPSNDMVNISGISSSTPIIFEQLTGKIMQIYSTTTTERNITLTTDALFASIVINTEGAITW